MLLPRYSLRTTLYGITACAVLFLIFGEAVRGKYWAIVVSVAVVSLIVMLLFHALLYLVTSALTRLVGASQAPARTSRGGVQLNSEQQTPPVAPVHDPSETKAQA